MKNLSTSSYNNIIVPQPRFSIRKSIAQNQRERKQQTEWKKRKERSAQK